MTNEACYDDVDGKLLVTVTVTTATTFVLYYSTSGQVKSIFSLLVFRAPASRAKLAA